MYAPGVSYHGDQYLFKGLSDLGEGAQNLSDQFAKIYQNGKIADQIVKTNPEVLQSLGMTPEQFGAMSARDRSTAVTGFIQGQGVKQQQTVFQAQQRQAQEQQGDQTILQQLLQQSGQPAGTADPSALGSGVSAMTPAGFKMLTEGRFNAMADNATQPVTAPVNMDGVTALLGGTPPPDGSTATAQPALDSNMLMTLARRAGMSPQDAMVLARGGLYNAKAEKDLRTGSNPEQIDTFQLPNNQTAVALRGSKQLQILTDPQTGLQVEQVPDAAGNMHAIVRNPKTGAPLFVPAANTAQATKVNMDTMVEAEKATRSIDDDIQTWQAQKADAAKDPKKKAPDPAVLDDLQKRRARLQNALDAGQPSAADVIPKQPAAGAAPAAAAPAAVPPNVKAEYDAANKALAEGRDPAVVRARLAQRLKALGFTAAPQ